MSNITLPMSSCSAPRSPPAPNSFSTTCASCPRASSQSVNGLRSLGSTRISALTQQLQGGQECRHAAHPRALHQRILQGRRIRLRRQPEHRQVPPSPRPQDRRRTLRPGGRRDREEALQGAQERSHRPLHQGRRAIPRRAALLTGENSEELRLNNLTTEVGGFDTVEAFRLGVVPDLLSLRPRNPC